ncbi:MAG: SPASM domain-containing protein [Ruminococcaceae bacterium]|nr:SPASM domain-containing protein [Oscillospiraceae bacterium]
MPPLSLMIKPASSLCNLSCEYCFYRDVSEHREHLGFGIMEKETAEILIQKALDYAAGESIAFAFQGGEPTLAGLDYFRFFTDCVNRLNTRKSKVFYSMQTNGTVIDGEWADFLRENQFLVGLSLDGDFDGNKFRKRPDGQNAFYKILTTAELLKKRKVDFNILTVLTGFCADNGERIYKYFRSKGFRYLQFIPCLRPFDSTEKSELYMTADQYADFLIKVFNLYVKDYVRHDYMSVRQFDNWVRLYLGHPTEQCGIKGHCSHQFVAEANGNIYPCDFYCTDEYFLGNIKETDFLTMEKSDTARLFIRESLKVPDRCKKCNVYPMCRAGGCKRTQQSEDYCKAYKRFFNACLPLFRVFINEQKPM